MPDTIIRAEGLGKKYVIGHQAERQRYVALRDVLANGAKTIWRKTTDMMTGRNFVPGDVTEEFWALRDVSFEVERGEVLGIIGRNGAGKSTLLKVLSRITEPSEGRVSIRGRVASLLEVGTGFHPELTGRENIYLNGAILGMTRAEIRRKFDEIVAFAEVEKFLDTPVKRYSSGMYVRLAFAVAAHLEPEILIVDEVLAVGDAEFQKKCLGKMSEVAGGGRTVLFVSHNLTAVTDLCSRALLLQNGSIRYSGDAQAAVTEYVERLQHEPVGKTVHYRQVNLDLHLKLSVGTGSVSVVSGEPLSLSLLCESSGEKRLEEFCLIFETITGQRVGIVDFRTYGLPIGFADGITEYAVEITNFALSAGQYFVKVWMSGSELGTELELGSIEVIETSNSATLSLYSPQLNGLVRFRGTVNRNVRTAVMPPREAVR